ncbi:uncharacterized protein LOC132265806 [Phlebotomus argentipes]|uniref:uncharacterized protein LOC132265806 n=1 Tax=Phlebotomus argentipes TaxID=94469 RepID=UPI002892C340|nr:uncharacterized protein LOC132265806 [Phlebotomus argentipes]
MKPFKRILIKLVELGACISCVITKALTDHEAKRVFLLNQKLSREWSLLHNITWSSAGNAFANVTFGGYTLVTALMVLSRIIDPRSNPTIIEKIFLTMGMFMFFVMGGLVFAALDQVPSALHDNAIILGCLSFLVAFLFIVDLSDPLARHRSGATQTDAAVFATAESGHSVAVQADDFKRPHVDTVETKTLPSAQEAVFARVLTPEKSRATKMKTATKSPFMVDQGSEDTLTYKRYGDFDDYMRGSVIERGNFILRVPPSSTSTFHPTLTREKNRDAEEMQAPVTPGYVVHAAKMWDKRARTTRQPPIGPNTVV